MSTAVQWALTLGVTLAAVALVCVAAEVRQLRHLLQRGTIRVQSSKLSVSSRNCEAVPSPSGYAIYVLRQGQWVLEADFSNPGYEAVAPSIAGSYEGQVIKKESGVKRAGPAHAALSR